MRILLTALTALMLFATPVVAGDWNERLYEASNAYFAGEHHKAYRLLKPLAEQGHAKAQAVLGVMYALGEGIAGAPKMGILGSGKIKDTPKNRCR
jgi:TPR repeat protein